MSALSGTTDAPRPSRGGRPRDPSRDGVIRAAILRLLADVGYGALTMDAVAAEAGVGKATIYRRWRTKQDLVVDTISDLNRAEATPRTPARSRGPAGDAAVAGLGHHRSGRRGDLSLLSTVPHQPALAEAFRNGPLAVWRTAFDEIWARAEQRGELRPGVSGSVAAEATSALLVQRWLLTGEPVDDAYADEVLETVVLPLLRTVRRDGLSSPPQGAGPALERADHLVGDPAAVEVAGLRPHRLAVDAVRGRPCRVEGHRTAQVLVAAARVLVGPADRGDRRPSTTASQ
jgi:AcrR family transcriptional regulator